MTGLLLCLQTLLQAKSVVMELTVLYRHKTVQSKRWKLIASRGQEACFFFFLGGGGGVGTTIISFLHMYIEITMN